MVSYSLSDIKVVGIKRRIDSLGRIVSRKSSVTLLVLKTTTIVIYLGEVDGKKVILLRE